MTESIRRLNVEPRYSDAAIYNGVVYLAGQVPDDASADMAGQTRQVLATIDRLLQEAGSSKSRILMCQIFLADMADIAVMNQVWDAWVDSANSPPRATVQAALADPDWRIEVVVTDARRPNAEP